MSRRDFYATWWKTSFPQAWAAARHISTVLTIAGGLAVYIWPTLDATRARMAWGLPLMALVSLTLYRLAVGAYELHMSHASRPAQRLVRMKELLLEASEYYRKLPADVEMDVHIADVWHIYKFLEEGCSAAIKDEYHKVSMAEPDKWRRSDVRYDHDKFTADYLKQLSGRLSRHDIDYGFVLPNSYRQFQSANSWPENERPISQSDLPRQ